MTSEQNYGVPDLECRVSGSRCPLACLYGTQDADPPQLMLVRLMRGGLPPPRFPGLMENVSVLPGHAHPDVRVFQAHVPGPPGNSGIRPGNSFMRGPKKLCNG